LIKRLRAVDEQRFVVVRSHLQTIWMERMQTLIAHGSGPAFLLWFAPRAPMNDAQSDDTGPQFITRQMIEGLRSYVDDVVEVVTPIGETDGLVFHPLDAPAVAEIMGIQAHCDAAKALRIPILHCAS